MKKIAYLFPGQGSQKVGMGQDVYEAKNYARAVFDAAEQVSGLPVRRLCFEGPMEELTQTVNLQPAITAVNLSYLSAIREAGLQPAICAGHSLGEFSALCAAGVVSEADCLKMTFKRGQLMHGEALQHSGAMSAIVGLTIDQVEPIVRETAQFGIVAVANHNSAEQIVITGAPEPVGIAGEKAAEKGARAIPLKVSGAWHSPLIKGAEVPFKTFLDTIEFKAPQTPVLHNVTAASESDPQKIKQRMAQQLCSPVRWYDTMLNMAAEQIDAYVEIGPGRVLSGLLRKFLPKDEAGKIHNVFDLKSLDKFLAAVVA